jgi:hypothetical protein
VSLAQETIDLPVSNRRAYLPDRSICPIFAGLFTARGLVRPGMHVSPQVPCPPKLPEFERKFTALRLWHVCQGWLPLEEDDVNGLFGLGLGDARGILRRKVEPQNVAG